jgi:hypothetical protein
VRAEIRCRCCEFSNGGHLRAAVILEVTRCGNVPSISTSHHAESRPGLRLRLNVNGWRGISQPLSSKEFL